MKINKVFRLITVGLFLAVLVIGTASGFKSKSKNRPFNTNEHKGFNGKNDMGFTDEQKEQMKTLKLNFVKEVTPIKNELGIKAATLKSASTGDHVDVKKVNKLIEEIGALKVEMSKMQFAHKQSVRSILTEEQKIMFDAHSQKRHRIGNNKEMKRHGENEFMHKRHQREKIIESACVE